MPESYVERMTGDGSSSRRGVTPSASEPVLARPGSSPSLLFTKRAVLGRMLRDRAVPGGVRPYPSLVEAASLPSFASSAALASTPLSPLLLYERQVSRRKFSLCHCTILLCHCIILTPPLHRPPLFSPSTGRPTPRAKGRREGWSTG